MRTIQLEEFVTRARAYESRPKERYYAEERGKPDTWYEVIHQHFEEVLLPEIKERGELFIDYWPAWLVADRERALRQGFGTDAFYNYEYGSHGTGYVCVTNRRAYLIVVKRLTEQFALVKTGMTAFIVDALSRRMNRLRPFQSDYAWTISPASLKAVSIASDHRETERIKMVTASGTWEVYEHFIGQREEIFHALKYLQNGEFRALRPSQHNTKRPPILHKADLQKHQARSGPDSLLCPSTTDPTRVERGLHIMDLHHLAAEFCLRGGADVELDLAHAAAARPDNPQLHELRRVFATIRHLLDRCENEAEVIDNLHIRIARIPQLAQVYKRSAAQLDRPYLKSRRPLPDRPHPALSRTMEEVGVLHHDKNASVCWGRDARTFITLGRDGMVRIWSLLTGSVLEEFRAFESVPVGSFQSQSPTDCTLSPDGQTLLTVHDRHSIKAWNTENWTLRFEVDVDWRVRYASFDAVGEHIAYYAGSNTVAVLDAKSGSRLEHRVDIPSLRLESGDRLYSFRLGPPGTWVLLQILEEDGLKSRFVGVDLASGEEMFAFVAFDVHEFEISPLGDRVLIHEGPRDDLSAWDIALGKWEYEIARRNGGPWKLSPLGSYIAFGLPDGRVVVHSVESGNELWTLKGLQAPVASCQFSSDERFLLSRHRGGVVKLWDLSKASLPFQLPEYFARGWDDDIQEARACGICDVNPLDETVIVGQRDYSYPYAVILSSSSGDISERYSEPLTDYPAGLRRAKLSQVNNLGVHIHSFAVGNNGRFLLLVGKEAWAVFDTHSLEAVYSGGTGDFPDITGRRCVSALSTDGCWLAIGADAVLMISNLATGTVKTLDTGSGIQSCVFDPQTSIVVWTSGGIHDRAHEFKAVSLDTWAVRDFDVPRVETKAGYHMPALEVWGGVRDISFTSDGSLVVAGHSWGVVSLWSTADLNLVNSWQAHSLNFPTSVACAPMPDNRTVVTVGSDRAVRAWDIATGECLSTLFTDGKLEDCATFSDGRRMVAVGEAGVYWLEIASG